MPSKDLPGVCYLRTINGAEAIQKAMQESSKAVVIGGGPPFIGISKWFSVECLSRRISMTKMLLYFFLSSVIIFSLITNLSSLPDQNSLVSKINASAEEEGNSIQNSTQYHEDHTQKDQKQQDTKQPPSNTSAMAGSNHTVPRKDVGDILSTVLSIQGTQETVNIQLSRILFKINPHYDKDRKITSLGLTLRPEMYNLYKKMGFSEESKNTIFVYPVFTQAAYNSNGFYDYYKNTCGTKCLTVNIPTEFKNTYTASGTSSLVLTLLNYSHITDIEVDRNPDILKKYDKIIILHNEYVTKKEFDAITHHPNVVYLYPNALYAEVMTDYNKNKITLVRGHGYPYANMTNGFNWQYDNSKFEYDVNCKDWKFFKVGNGKMLNCYPEIVMSFDQSLLVAIKN